MRVIEYIGIATFMLGVASMDSESQLIPAIMTVAGLAVMMLAFRRDHTVDMD